MTPQVGGEDEAGAAGTVAFEIWADGAKAASTGGCPSSVGRLPCLSRVPCVDARRCGRTPPGTPPHAAGARGHFVAQAHLLGARGTAQRSRRLRSRRTQAHHHALLLGARGTARRSRRLRSRRTQAHHTPLFSGARGTAQRS
ncbi:hypothetical protein [Streptomyces sp. Y7]|uniref:hypothetical protein n=1 Tax=Streptomyces sp. Y7 TaxID=3342392 RepID=UPI00371D0C54